MTATIIEDPGIRDKIGVFRDRDDAGEVLAKGLEQFRGTDSIVLAIPSGGVPVGLKVAFSLALPFDLLIIRKIPIPGNTEAGFGAISLDGDRLLNPSLVRMLGLSDREIDELAERVMQELKVRNRLFRQDRPLPEIKGRTVILVDDGLASGYTMMTAVRIVRRRDPADIVVAVPTASWNTIEILLDEVDTIVCPNIRTGSFFAVADAYLNWYDLSRDEVLNLLKKYETTRPKSEA